MRCGTPVLYKNEQDDQTEPAYILEKLRDEEQPYYSIILCHNNRERIANEDQLQPVYLDVLEKDYLDASSLAGFLESLGLQQLHERIVSTLSDNILELCEQLLDNFDTMNQDLKDIGIVNDEERAQILLGLQLVMSREYKIACGNRFDDMAAETITRFIRYAAAIKSGRVAKGTSSILMHVMSLTNKSKKHRRHYASLMITRFVRYAGAVQAGKLALVARTFTMHSENEMTRKHRGGSKSKKKPKRRSSVMKQVFAQRAMRKSVYDGEVVIEGYLKKMNSGPFKKWTRRYFSIRGSYLKYFPSADKEVVRGAFDLREVVKCELLVGVNSNSPRASDATSPRDNQGSVSIDTSGMSDRCIILLESQSGGSKKPSTFKLEAESEAEAKRWVEAIQSIPGAHKKYHELHS